MIEFDFKKPIKTPVRATIHKTGKLFFSLSAAEILIIDSKKRFQVAVNKDKKDRSIYLFHSEKEGFKVKKAGDYYYLNIRHIVDELGYDYKSKSIKMEIKYGSQGGSIFYQLKEE